VRSEALLDLGVAMVDAILACGFRALPTVTLVLRA
jgi:hypothetical protein